MKYKTEIDGLRALAVMLVLLCHMELGLPGGYIGVDVFFVISGFLITSTVMSSLEQKRFSFWKFYAKRFIRLYPALLAVIIITFILGFLLLDPVLMGWLGRTGKYALTSTSNLFYNAHLGYFDIAGQRQVFLHTWSLGVEWQFYLISPVLLWLTLKVSHRLVFALLLVITLASLYTSQWMLTHGQATSAYYLMPSRAFEIGLGALLVFFYNRQIGPRAGCLWVVIGLACILIASFIYNPKTPFPGIYALLPCLGSVACIYGAKAFAKGNVLRFAPVVFIGKISYSVYLVHWPLFVLYKYYVFRDLYFIEKISLTATALILGALLYKLVEARYTWGSLKYRGRACLVMLVIVGLFVALFDYSNRPSKGLSWRIPTSNPVNQAPFYNWGIGSFSGAEVSLGNPAGKLVAMVAGDSFSGNMSTGLNNYLDTKNQRIERFFAPGCLITVLDKNYPLITPACRTLAEHVVALAQKNPDLPLILIQAWGATGFKDNPQKQAEYDQFIATNLDNLRANLPQTPIFLVGSPLYREWAKGEKDCLRRPPYLPQICQLQIPDYTTQQAFAYYSNIALEKYAQQHNYVFYINLTPVNCPQGVCTTLDNAKLYFDGFHASEYGADIMGRYILQEVERTLNQSVKLKND